MNLQKMKEFVQLLHLRREKDFDNFIAVTGLKGSGKSTFLYHLGNEYMKAMGREFDIEKHVVYSDSFEEIFEKIRNAEDGDYIWFDEGGRIILAEDWNSIKSKKLKKLFGEVRTKHLTVAFAVPFSFIRIDKKYRESLFNFWVWIPRRGYALVFEPLIHPTLQGFMEEEINRKVKPLSWSLTLKETSETYFYDALKRFPSFMDVIRFTEMPKAIHEKYLMLRDKAVYEEDVEDDTNGRTKGSLIEYAFYLLIEFVKESMNLSYGDIFRVLEKKSDGIIKYDSMRARLSQIKKRWNYGNIAIQK